MIKKILMALALVGFVAGFCGATDYGTLPTDKNGRSFATLDTIGTDEVLKFSTVLLSTGTGEILNSGPCVLYGVMVSSNIIAGTYVVLRDTNSLNNASTSDILAGNLVFHNDAATRIYMFPVPAQLDLGFYALIANATADPVDQEVTFFVLDK